MAPESEFYVGYLNKMGKKTKVVIRRFLVIILLILVVSAVAFAGFQDRAKNSVFELNTSTSLTGVLHEMPYPLLRVKIKEDTYKNILLIGFGKFSANLYLKKIKEENTSLDQKTLRIQGNLIYYNGKTLLQLTDSEKISVVKTADYTAPKLQAAGIKNLKGEIIDPKCFFGVMKPGRGKIHKSCAIRCISGGIPPVFAVTNENNEEFYYLITDPDGNAISDAILPFVGKPVNISGQVMQYEDWQILRLDINEVKVLQNAKSVIY